MLKRSWCLIFVSISFDRDPWFFSPLIGNESGVWTSYSILCNVEVGVVNLYGRFIEQLISYIYSTLKFDDLKLALLFKTLALSNI